MKAPASGFRDRADQTAQRGCRRCEAEIAALGNTELRVVSLGDGEGDQGTLLMTALAEAMAEEPRARLAGAILLTDGQLHDIDRAPDLPAPLHTLLTGHDDRLGSAADGDQRAGLCHSGRAGDADPADRGSGRGAGGTWRTGRSADRRRWRRTAMRSACRSGEDLELPVTLPHGGMNVIQFTRARRRTAN